MRETKLSKTLVKDISELVVKNPTIVSSDMPLRDVLKAILKDLHTRHAYVVNQKNVLIGSIRVNCIIQYLFPTVTLLEDKEIPQVSTFMEFHDAKTAKDIMNENPQFVYENTKLAEIARLMMSEKINEIPVLDKDKRVIGEVNILEIIAYFLKTDMSIS